VGGRFIGACFFVPLKVRPASDGELFAALGYDQARGTFGPIGVAEHRIDVLSDHVCAQLYCLHSEFLGLLPPVGQEVPLAQDPALPLAIALRDGAARARAEVALLEIHRPVLEEILEKYWMVQIGDDTALLAERFALLHLDDSLVAQWKPRPAFEDRDELPDGPGRTVFSQRGAKRWF